MRIYKIKIKNPKYKISFNFIFGIKMSTYGSIINWTDDKIHQSNFYVLNRKRRNYLYNY